MQPTLWCSRYTSYQSYLLKMKQDFGRAYLWYRHINIHAPQLLICVLSCIELNIHFLSICYSIGEGIWSVGGIQTNNVKQQGEGFILDCTSNHLTAFAAVVDISVVRHITVKSSMVLTT